MIERALHRDRNVRPPRLRDAQLPDGSGLGAPRPVVAVTHDEVDVGVLGEREQIELTRPVDGGACDTHHRVVMSARRECLAQLADVLRKTVAGAVVHGLEVDVHAVGAAGFHRVDHVADASRAERVVAAQLEDLGAGEERERDVDLHAVLVRSVDEVGVGPTVRRAERTVAVHVHREVGDVRQQVPAHVLPRVDPVRVVAVHDPLHTRRRFVGAVDDGRRREVEGCDVLVRFERLLVRRLRQRGAREEEAGEDERALHASWFSCGEGAENQTRFRATVRHPERS